jgi:hypothetical protein
MPFLRPYLRIRFRGAGPLVASGQVYDNIRPLALSQKDSFALKQSFYFLYERFYLVRPVGIKPPDRLDTHLEKL